jgi:hypothetical protein
MRWGGLRFAPAGRLRSCPCGSDADDKVRPRACTLGDKTPAKRCRVGDDAPKNLLHVSEFYKTRASRPLHHGRRLRRKECCPHLRPFAHRLILQFGMQMCDQAGHAICIIPTPKSKIANLVLAA